MNTVYFCTERAFPRGDAGANRILHMAKALGMVNWRAKVYSMGHKNSDHWCETEKSYVYDGVPYETVAEYGMGKIGNIVRRLSAGYSCVAYLKRMKIKPGDAVIVYSSSYGFCRPVYEYVRRLRGVQLMFDVVEWHQPFQFDTLSTRYIYCSFKKCFDRLFGRTGKVIVISECLKKHFESIGCKALRLPIYITPDEKCATGSPEGELHLIYPGNPYQKDSLEVMLKALDALDAVERTRVRFHLTSVKKAFLRMCIPNEEMLLERLVNEGIVIVHEWMEYEELMRLYDGMDFAFIARPDNIVTQANYPSKVPELMNRGIPPMITRVGDIALELTDGQDAVLMEECTPSVCCEAIRRCMRMTKAQVRAMHEAAKICAAQQFDYRLSAELLADFLRN